MLWHRGEEAGRWEQGVCGRGGSAQSQKKSQSWGRGPPKLGACLEKHYPQQRECHHEPLGATRGTSSLWQTPNLVSNDSTSSIWCQLYAQ